MDPLSVSASIVGILGAATKVSSVLHNFVQNAKGAPKLAQTVLAEVNGLSTVLGHLQTYILGLATSSNSRTSLILVEQVIVTLADCVTTFSELEAVLGTARIESELRILDRVTWAIKEPKVADIQGRLQSNKSSLTLMLTILSCKSNQEAESATSRLCDLVEQVLAENREMSLRLRNIDNVITDQAKSKEPERDRDASITSSGTAIPPYGPSRDVQEDVQRNNLGFAFEEDLFASRVYRKPLFSQSGDSIVTSAVRTTAWSLLSGISLTDVSDISVLAVPIYAHEISNSARYIFGDFQPESLTVEGREAASNAVQQTSKIEKGDGFAHVLFSGSGNASKSDDPRQPEPKVLGVPLPDLIKPNDIPISLTNKKDESYIYSYIPIYASKTEMSPKEKVHPATDVENIFSISGFARHLRELEAFGKELNWERDTLHKGMCCLLRYLLRCPESVIPVKYYEAFHGPLKEKSFHAITVQRIAYPEFEYETAIGEYQQLIISLPHNSRTSLLYLVDLLALLASSSGIFKMTSQRLAAIFQPAILSPGKIGGDFIKKEGSYQLSQKVIGFLIENADLFLWDS